MRLKFDKIYNSLEEIKDIDRSDPFMVAALTVHAICTYSTNKEESLKMIAYLMDENIQPMSNLLKQEIEDSMRDKKDYIGKSYFVGATNVNNYVPSEPLEIEVKENSYSYENEGYARLLLHSGGADSDRIITLRKTKDNRYLLFSDTIRGLLAGIRIPESENPWA